MTKQTTEPISKGSFQEAPHLTVAATWEDPITHALYVHQDLLKHRDDWANEEHISPMAANESFGDVESFAAYVQRFAKQSDSFLTWNSCGISAVLDYADDETGEPGRCQWRARLPFVASSQWQTWMQLANGSPRSQKQAVEALEDLSEDIKDPSPADLMGLLRSLRATVNARADAELRPDGTSKVSFEKDSKIQSTASVDVPSSFKIAIPVLKGHTDEHGRPVLLSFEVKIRVSVGDDAKLGLRFSIPNADRVLEVVYAERVEATKALLGDEFTLLRAAD